MDQNMFGLGQTSKEYRNVDMYAYIIIYYFIIYYNDFLSLLQVRIWMNYFIKKFFLASSMHKKMRMFFLIYYNRCDVYDLK